MDANLGLDQDLINAVAAITEASCSAKKMEKEELHPNQKVLDKNKNGKLDADDFKKLRKEEEEVDEALRIKDNSISGHNLEKDKENKWPHHSDAMRRAAADTVKDYRKNHGSNNKNLEKETGYVVRKEEVEELDELSKTTLGSYVKKAGQHRVSLAGKEKELGDTVNKLQKAKNDMDDDNYSKVSDVQDIVSKQRNAVSDKSVSRARGIHTAIKKLTKEQVEEIEALAAKHGLGE